MNLEDPKSPPDRSPSPADRNHTAVRPAATTLLGRLTAPMPLSQLVTTLAMLACLWLPHSLADDGVMRRPAAVAENFEEKTIVPAVSLWPYLFAMCTLVATVSLAVFRPRRVEALLLGVPLAFFVLLTGSWFLVLFSDADGSRMAMASGAMVAPLATLVVLRMYWLYQVGEIIWVATWGQGFLSVLAVFSLRWFWWPPVEQMLPGGWISVAAAVGMVLASWTWPRTAHDLIDPRIPAKTFQMSIFQISVAIGMFAMAAAVWRYLAG